MIAIVQLARAARLPVAHVLLGASAKSPAFAPSIVIALIDNGAVPLFVSVMVRGLVVVPTMRRPNARLEELIVTLAWRPVALSGMLHGPSSALEPITSVALNGPACC